ncbi:MAG: dephospho-CoA kinase [Bacteroidetes bacterium]|nr:dephospho-CoA kinase [Bacteroidota bacterium]
MLKIGLTGNIGSGKSTIAQIFKVLGVPVYVADDEAKKIINQPEIKAEVLCKYGRTMLTENVIDRKKLAALVFADVDALLWLNQLIHPFVKADFDNWIAQLPNDCLYAIEEAAILFESGFDKYVDKTILVTAPENMRMQRVMQRDDVEAELFLQRSAHQWDENCKIQLADFRIINDDTQLVIPQVMELHRIFTNK